MRKLLAILMLSLSFATAWAIDSAPAFEDPAMQERYDRLIRELRCLTCRNYSIAESNVFLAVDLRRQVRELMAAGKSDREILEYMTSRYGDYVLYNPPVAPRTWLLWAAPGLLVLVGGVAAAVVIVRKSRLPQTDPPDVDAGAS
jgi:cytochrome c-type biogenesis protein CcmH